MGFYVAFCSRLNEAALKNASCRACRWAAVRTLQLWQSVGYAGDCELLWITDVSVG